MEIFFSNYNDLLVKFQLIHITKKTQTEWLHRSAEYIANKQTIIQETNNKLVHLIDQISCYKEL